MFLNIILFFSCTKENVEVVYDPEFEFYIDQFLIEAEKRDLNLSLDNLEIVFGDEIGENVAGRCLPREYKIEINQPRWERKDSTERLFLIFHELGHCVLNKLHKSTFLPNGECQSLMREGLTECSQNIYSKKWQEYYFDELFGKSETYPTWYFENISYSENLNKEIIFEKKEASIFNFSEDFEILRNRDFEIEVIGFFENDYYSSLFTSIGEITITSSQTDRVQLINDGNTIYLYRRDSLVRNNPKITFRQLGEWQYLFLDENYLHKMERIDLENFTLTFSTFEDEKVNIDLTVKLLE